MKAAVRSRLRSLESQRKTVTSGTRWTVFYDDDLVRCGAHTDCQVEVETGEHHSGVIMLEFSDRPS